MTGDQVYFKFATSREWHGPATALGHNGQQVLIKSDSTYIRVHPYRLHLTQDVIQLHQAPLK